MKIAAEHIKQYASKMGIPLCGIASIESFSGAPEGFHPTDVYKDCRSVLVLAKPFLKSTIFAESTIPYTDVRNYLTRFMDNTAIKLSYELEMSGTGAVPVNAIGPTEWDAAAKKSRGIISLKHAAECAGLGRIGKNTLLVNDRYGNMIWLSAVLVAGELEPDPPAQYETCPEKCTLCLDICPQQALDGISIDQKKCWEYAFGTHNGGEWRIKCFHCRSVCPYRMGIRQKSRTDVSVSRPDGTDVYRPEPQLKCR